MDAWKMWAWAPKRTEAGEVKQDKESLPYKDDKLGFRHSTNLDIWVWGGNGIRTRMSTWWLEKQFFKLATILETKTRESSTKKVMKMMWGLGRGCRDDSALRALVVIAGVWVPAPMQWLTAICNPNANAEDTTSSSGFWRQCTHMVHRQTLKQNTHTHKINISKKNIWGERTWSRGLMRQFSQ